MYFLIIFGALIAAGEYIIGYGPLNFVASQEGHHSYRQAYGWGALFYK